MLTNFIHFDPLQLFPNNLYRFILFLIAMATLAKLNLAINTMEFTKLLASHNLKIRSNGIELVKKLVKNNTGNTTNDLFYLLN